MMPKDQRTTGVGLQLDPITKSMRMVRSSRAWGNSAGISGMA